MYLSVKVSENVGRVIVQTLTTDGSNRLINFPMCSEFKKEQQKLIKRPKTKN